ncbi:Glycosyl transferase family 8 [Seminavis robusta]|uniref:Glycosyl transferase family 8 n=1 Tax=Seminavis robusta TaxID=568900 RepID=A0A9N8HF12_9STRA|nr:Glycosyl transferase family 8 [Seminavis robusta]|eukprot:Sro327_g118370.1 Glycosyl transferase family 8 (640) ;mRNA; f:39522-41535
MITWTSFRTGLAVLVLVFFLSNLNGSRKTSKAVLDLNSDEAVTLPDHEAAAVASLTDAQLDSVYFGRKQKSLANGAASSKREGQRKVRGQPFHETQEQQRIATDQQVTGAQVEESRNSVQEGEETAPHNKKQDTDFESNNSVAQNGMKNEGSAFAITDEKGTIDMSTTNENKHGDVGNSVAHIETQDNPQDLGADAQEMVAEDSTDAAEATEEGTEEMDAEVEDAKEEETPSSKKATEIIPKGPAWSSSWVSPQTGSPYTYAMFSWMCDPGDVSISNPVPGYKTYLANILVASKLLRDFGSKADFNVVIKMNYKSNHTQLLEEDEKMMQALGIRLIYLPKTKDGKNFYVDQLNKMYIFNMTQYRRVLYLDGDVMPTNNLDYLFELSDGPNPMIKENAVLAGYTEPANGGFFMMRPNATAYQDILSMIAGRTLQSLKRLKWFDQEKGWGHTIVPPDKFETNYPKKEGTKWKFHGAMTDQGLLYSYPKYNLQSMTQILSRKIINFGPGPNGTTVIEKVMNVTSVKSSPFSKLSKPQFAFSPSSCMMFTYKYAPGWPGCVPPYADHSHFSGKKKPWKYRKPKDLWEDAKPRNDFYLWWRTLDKLQQDGINITFTESRKGSKHAKKKKDNKNDKKKSAKKGKR